MPEWWQGFTAGVFVTLLIVQMISSMRRTDQRIRELGGETEHNIKMLRKERPDLFDEKGRPHKAGKRSAQERREDAEAVNRALERFGEDRIE